MSRMWSSRLFPVFALIAALMLMSAPARTQSIIPSAQNGYVAPPILRPPPDIPDYQRPKFVPIEWPLVPERFCTQAEKDALLADLDRRLALADANADLADEFRNYFDRRMAAAERVGASAGFLTALGAELEQVEALRAYHFEVLSTWRGIRGRLRATPVTSCPKDPFGPAPLPVPAPPPPPPSSVVPEGYFSGPVTVGLPPEPSRGARPSFAPIDFLPVATAFCSEAQKAAYLRQVAELVALAELNHSIAFYYQRNMVGRAEVYAQVGDMAEAARWEAEAKAYEPIVDYHRTVLDTWLGIQKRVSVLPVIDCNRPVDGSRPADPPRLPETAPEATDGFVQPSKDPNGNPFDLPDIPEKFCSVEERSAYLANTFDPMIRAARQKAEAAYKAMKALQAKGVTGLQMDLASISWTSASGRADLLVYLRADIFEMPIVDCRRPGSRGQIVPEGFVQPSQDIKGNHLNLPDIPDKFCSETERAAYLLGRFDPMLADEIAKAQALRARYEQAKAEYERAAKAAGERALYDLQLAALYGQLNGAAFNLDFQEARVKALQALREQVMKQPIVPCGPEDRFIDPADVDRISAPVDLPAAPPPLDLPTKFCTEAERLAYLTDVYHPLAQAASRAAVEAYAKLDRLYSELERAQRAGDRSAALVLEEQIKRQRLEALELAELARRLIALRDVILRIPIVSCPKDESGPADDATPPIAGARPSPPPGIDVRDATPLESDVLAEINLLRSDPAGYAAFLSGAVPGTRRADVEDAMRFLQSAAPAPVLEFDPRLAGAAIAHADDIGPRGLTTHTGSDGSTVGARIRRQGLIATLTAEELSYGQTRARAVVVQFIIDAGVAGAPHRRDLLNPVFRRGGVGCGPHKQYRTVCVITFSGPEFAPEG